MNLLCKTTKMTKYIPPKKGLCVSDKIGPIAHFSLLMLYFSFHLSFSLLAKTYNLLTIKPNLFFVRLNLISLKLQTIGQRKKYFRLSGSGGDSLNLIWRGNEHLQPTRTMSMTLFVKNTAFARTNEPNFVRATETRHGTYVICHF